MAHHPTADTRQTVENGAGLGLPQEMIALLLDIAPKTLRSKYKKELKLGKAKASMNVLASHYKQCLAGNMTAIIWYEKTQLGFKEPPREITTPPGQPFETAMVPGSPLLLRDYYAKIAQSAAALAPDPAAPDPVGSDGPGGEEPGSDEDAGPR
jgi:hypothetical protein